MPLMVAQATGVRVDLPAHLSGLMSAPERSTAVRNDLAAVQAFVASVSGAR